VYWFANDVPALVHAGIRALNLAERAGPSPELARAHAIICLAAGSIPLHPIARGYARRAERAARRAGQLWPLAYVRFITSVYHIGAARWQQVQEALEEAEALFERLGDRRLLGDTWSVQGLLALCRGQFDPAGATFAKLYERGARNENVQHQVWACIGWAECELRAGRAGEAARLLETALILLTEHPDEAEQVRAYGLLAVVHLHRGEETAARAAAASAARLITQFKRPTSFYLLEGYAGVAEVYLSCGRPATAHSRPGERPGRPVQRCAPSRAYSQSASPAPACGAAAFTTSQGGRSGHSGPGGQACLPPNGSACPSRPPSPTSNSVGLLTVSRSDNGTSSKPRACCTNSESSNFPHSNHLRCRHLSTVRPAGLWLSG
jgi:tetratricopeptide (TPR) repeat protein